MHHIMGDILPLDVEMLDISLKISINIPEHSELGFPFGYFPKSAPPKRE